MASPTQWCSVVPGITKSQTWLSDWTTTATAYLSFPGGSVLKNPPANAGDVGSIPSLGRSLGEGDGNPLQHSCLENPMDKGAWQATVHGIANELDMTETKQQFHIKH